MLNLKQDYILVAGANGFVGYYLVKKMLENNYKIVAVDYKTNYLTEFKSNPNIKIIKTDLVAGLSEIYNIKVQCIVNLASIGHGSLISKKNELDLLPLYWNIKITENLFKFAVLYDVKQYIQMSSAAVYSDLENIDENSLVVMPKSPYAISKSAMESLGMIYTELGMINVVSFRAFNIYGYNKFADKYSSNFIHNLINYSIDSKNAIVYGDLLCERDYIYVEDVVAAIIFAIDNKLSPGVYNLGTGKSFNANEIWNHICKITGKKGKILSLRRNYYNIPKKSCANVSKIERCGFVCNETIDSGIKKIIKFCL